MKVTQRPLAEWGACMSDCDGWQGSVEAAPFGWSTVWLLLWAVVRDIWEAVDWGRGQLPEVKRDT